MEVGITTHHTLDSPQHGAHNIGFMTIAQYRHFLPSLFTLHSALLKVRLLGRCVCVSLYPRGVDLSPSGQGTKEQPSQTVIIEGTNRTNHGCHYGYDNGPYEASFTPCTPLRTQQEMLPPRVASHSNPVSPSPRQPICHPALIQPLLHAQMQPIPHTALSTHLPYPV